ncbi:hypothetical protein TPA0907_34150 [Micromonospora humidisoli]|nr:hypothetical protein TPA0907_34150 [Micromonospora sp. AKA109]
MASLTARFIPLPPTSRPNVPNVCLHIATRCVRSTTLGKVESRAAPPVGGEIRRPRLLRGPSPVEGQEAAPVPSTATKGEHRAGHAGARQPTAARAAPQA